MIRKPTNWEEVDKDFIEVEPNTPRFTAEELDIEKRAWYDFSIVVPNVFIVLRGAKEYVVRTEGYHSMRYVQRIK